MLSFFRLNDPYRLAAVFLVLLLIRLPFWLDLDNLLFMEVKWLVVGSKMAQGDVMYQGVWDNTAPLASGIYWLLNLLFGKSHFVFGFFAFIIALYQSIIFNEIILRNNAIPENTYVPSIIYGLTISFSEEFMLLSPQLLGLTFFLLGLRNVFSHIQLRAKKDEKILMIGFHMGIASMFYLPFTIFFITTLLVFVIFTGTVTRRYFLLITGFLIPLFLVLSYNLIIGNIGYFLDNLVLGSINIPVIWHLDYLMMAAALGIPFVFLLLAFYRLLKRTRLTNFQTRLIQAMLIYFVAGVIVFILSRDKSVISWMILIPSFSFFLSHYFLLLRRGFRTELLFLIWFVLFGLNGIALHYNWFGVNDYLNMNSLYVMKSSETDLKGQNVLILGTDWSVLREANHVTPFLNWRLSEKVFSNLDDYQNQTIILKQLEEQPPDFVLDREDLYPDLARYFPTVEKRYEKVRPSTYKRKN